MTTKNSYPIKTRQQTTIDIVRESFENHKNQVNNQMKRMNGRLLNIEKILIDAQQGTVKFAYVERFQ